MLKRSQRHGKTVKAIAEAPSLDAYEQWFLDLYLNLRATRGGQRISACEIESAVRLLGVKSADMRETVFKVVAAVEADREKHNRELEEANADPRRSDQRR